MHGMTHGALPSDAPRYDDTGWPLFAIEMPPERMSPASFDAHLARCSSVFDRREPFLLLVDMADHPSLIASQRNAVAEAMRADGERHPGLCRGVAVVVRSSFERSIVQSIHSMSNQPYPVTAFATVAEARAWLSSLKLPGAALPSRRSHELPAPPSRRARSSAPPFSQRVREAPAPFSRRPRESMPPLSRRPRESVMAFSRRPRDAG